ncbi:MAG: DUF2723 domain-containing protein, partial [candidate division Zixibacteria bacterium]|nr:DUF2723 domain-containing protein [candidate division Zixibacteria bacterium]
MFILSLALYVATMCRTVFWWDTGELAANAGILGIPHRPGFPLYVIVAHLMTLTPFGDVFYRVNFLSAASAAVALAFLAYLWYELAAQQLRPRRRWEAIAPVTMSLLAMAGTYTLWMQAVRAEVYAPNLMLVTLLFGCVWGA